MGGAGCGVWDTPHDVKGSGECGRRHCPTACGPPGDFSGGGLMLACDGVLHPVSWEGRCGHEKASALPPDPERARACVACCKVINFIEKHVKRYLLIKSFF